NNDKANVNTQAGAMIGSRLVEGNAIRGQAVLEASDAIATRAQEATEYIDNTVVPREYQDAVKHYFGRLQESVREEQKRATEAPTEDAQDAGGN
ncbi:MAG: hypothetical protein KDA28_13180, partial [Phycisphaerales bacterium]|nr:hypothetical protein [Phycisphaerales bacterium]